MRRLLTLVQQGQDEGVFRTDLPAVWLVATFYNVAHGAADEIAAGRVADNAAAQLITATLLAAFTPPGQPVPPAESFL
jgi:TetR/AcrR family transcriptional regulator, mexCD-oprJ operon repressor